MSTLLLYRLIQKGYYAVLSDIETVEADKAVAIDNRRIETPMDGNKAVAMTVVRKSNDKLDVVVKGVFCRDMAAVGSLISRAGLRQPITV